MPIALTPPAIWIVGVITAGMTAFYMFRLYFMTFHGEYRGFEKVGIEQSEPEHGGEDLIPSSAHLDQGDAHSDKAHGHHAHGHTPHESPWSMTGVLIVLAFLALVGGYIGWPAALGGSHPTPFQRWLEPVLLALGNEPWEFHEGSATVEILLMAASVGIAGLGVLLAYMFYLRDQTWSVPKRLATRFRPVYEMLANKYYVDEIYDATVVQPIRLTSEFGLWQIVDVGVIDAAVNGAGSVVAGVSGRLRRLQTGSVRAYAASVFFGVVLILGYYLWR